MERASRLISRLKLPTGTVTPEDLACAVWPLAVGKTIAAHTKAASLVRTTLVVEVEDAIWRRQLHVLEAQIVRKLTEALGPSVVDGVEFRIGIPRREPQRAVTSRASLDEADAIEDPLLRKIYVARRRRELA